MRDRTLDGFPSKTVLIDLDGTLVAWVEQPNPGVEGISVVGPLLPGALQAVRYLYSQGYNIVICTARPNLQPVEDWLKNTPELQNLGIRITNVKEPAVLFIDDRNYRFNGNWDKEFLKIQEILDYHSDVKMSWFKKRVKALVHWLNWNNTK